VPPKGIADDSEHKHDGHQKKGQCCEHHGHPRELLRFAYSCWSGKNHHPLNLGAHRANFEPTKREGTDGRQIVDHKRALLLRRLRRKRRKRKAQEKAVNES
jgi:hypothetical protein